jgi:hypothetical protein
MEFVDGPPLKSLLDKQERLGLAVTVRIMEDLLAGCSSAISMAWCTGTSNRPM